MAELITANDLVEAISIAEGSFPTDDQPSNHQLISAELMLGGRPGGSGVRVWRLTFKPARLLPETADAPIGAGGELFFTVDLDERTATYTGGE